MGRINVTYSIFEGPSGPNDIKHFEAHAMRSSMTQSMTHNDAHHPIVGFKSENTAQVTQSSVMIMLSDASYPCGRGNSAISDA